MDAPASTSSAKKLPICYVCDMAIGSLIEPTLGANVCADCGTQCVLASRQLAKAGLTVCSTEVLPPSQ